MRSDTENKQLFIQEFFLGNYSMLRNQPLKNGFNILVLLFN